MGSGELSQTCDCTACETKLFGHEPWTANNINEGRDPSAYFPVLTSELSLACLQLIQRHAHRCIELQHHYVCWGREAVVQGSLPLDKEALDYL
jgi:hypothetical protein